jgi:hypothetical protein
MRRRLFIAVAALALVAAAWSALALRDESGGSAASSASPTARASEHPVEVPVAARTVVVSRTMPMPSAHARRLSTMLEHGTMPAHPMMAEVLTDSECTPDAQMISRCRNLVRLADGREIVLRHPHDMSKVPCLAPGERVRLMPLGV